MIRGTLSWRYSFAIVFGLLAAPLSMAASTAMTFSPQSQEHSWALGVLDRDLPSDWSGSNFLVLEMRASSPQPFELRLFTPGGTRRVKIFPFSGVWIRAAIPLMYLNQAQHTGHDLASMWNKPRDTFWLNLVSGAGSLGNVQAIGFAMPWPIGRPTLEIRSIRLASDDPGDAVLEPGPLVDQFGQWVHDDWPGKAASLDDLHKRWKEEDAQLTPGNFDFDSFGGYAHTQARPTGFFRVEQVYGRWWFVDPEGHLFLSMGADVVSPYQETRITGREGMFALVPPPSALPPPRWPGDVPGVSYFSLNLGRRFGSDWQNKWADMTLRRMSAWGLNTLGNWSVPFAPQRPVPYVKMLQLGLEHTLMGLPDVYAQQFSQGVERAADQQCTPNKSDKYLLGYFLGNELPFSGREVELTEQLQKGADTPMKQKLVAYLAQADTPEQRKKFVFETLDRFVQIVCDAVRRHDPNHLILGLRFGNATSVPVLEACRRFDVFSLNSYSIDADPKRVELAYQITGRPILIGEFHFGTPGRGMAGGVVPVKDQEQRGVAYQYYVENAIAHPAIIGAHWFEWADEPNTSRFDGENYNIGLVDVTDTPYPQMVAAMVRTHQRLFDVHVGKQSPVSVLPRVN
jgi:hypothetical protein